MRSSNEADRNKHGMLPETWALVRPFLPVTIIATSLGILSGLATAWLLATINEGLHSANAAPADLLWRFAGLCLLSILGSAVAGVANSIAGQRMIANLRKRIAATISKTDLDVVERYRPHRLLAIISNDVDTVSAFTFSFPGYAIALAIISGSLVYLAYLSLPVFLLFVGAVSVAIALSAYSKVGWARDYEKVRRAQDQLQEQYRAITEGAKEIRLNQDRHTRVHGVHLSQAVDIIADRKIAAMRRFWMTGSIGNGIVFLVIGALLGLQGRMGMSTSVASGAILVMLYIRGPVEQLLNGLPAFFQAQVAFRRISELSATLGEREAADRSSIVPLNPPRESITVRDVTFAFRSQDGGAPFALGPLTLHVAVGQTLFVVGENGSGKTTLIKILLGLYHPDTGEICLDGERVEPDELQQYRQLFSSVFSDYFLFSELLDGGADLLVRAEAYLEEFEIAHKVDINERRFSNIDLSTGQRKRLALIHAYLEHRPIIMFDEWAADQDPTFRRVFYEKILPDLKRQGKTVIVISHDDRFYHLADHLIEMRDGKIINDTNIEAPTLPRPSWTYSHDC